MPRGDKTGPAGQGALTGRRAGFCMGNDTAGFQSAGSGRVWGRSFHCGGGRGRHNRSYATGRPAGMRYGAAPAAYGPQDEKLWLQHQADALQTQLRSIEQRLGEMNSAMSNG